MLFRRAAFALTALSLWLEFGTAAGAGTVSTYRDNVALDCIHQAAPEASTAARMLAIMHAAMYDAWTAYDPIAAPSRANGILKRPPEETSDSNEIEVVSFAAHYSPAAKADPSDDPNAWQLVQTAGGRVVQRDSADNPEQ